MFSGGCSNWILQLLIFLLKFVPTPHHAYRQSSYLSHCPLRAAHQNLFCANSETFKFCGKQHVIKRDKCLQLGSLNSSSLCNLARRKDSAVWMGVPTWWTCVYKQQQEKAIAHFMVLSKHLLQTRRKKKENRVILATATLSNILIAWPSQHLTSANCLLHVNNMAVKREQNVQPCFILSKGWLFHEFLKSFHQLLYWWLCLLGCEWLHYGINVEPPFWCSCFCSEKR